jgi:nucleoside-diphosphate-sugar epimerase
MVDFSFRQADPRARPVHPLIQGTPPARRALVFGATSQIGFFLLPRLAQYELEVTALTRSDVRRSEETPTGVSWRTYSTETLASSMDDIAPVPIAIFLTPLPWLPPLISELAKVGVRRLIAFGTTGRFYKSESADIAEQSYIRQVIEAEEEIAALCEEHQIAWTLFRPTLVYGCGRDRNITFIAKFVQRFGFFPLFSGGRGLRQPVHADDLAQACIQVLDNPRTYGKSYILSGGSTVTYREMVESVFSELDKPVRTPAVPLALFHAAIRIANAFPRLRGLSPEMATRMGADMCFDHQEAANDFGFAPRPFALNRLAVGVEDFSKSRN